MLTAPWPAPPQVPSLNPQGLIMVQPSLAANDAAVRRAMRNVRGAAPAAGAGDVRDRVVAYSGFGAQARPGSKGISQAPTPTIWVGSVGAEASADDVRAVFGRCGALGDSGHAGGMGTQRVRLLCSCLAMPGGALGSCSQSLYQSCSSRCHARPLSCELPSPALPPCLALDAGTGLWCSGRCSRPRAAACTTQSCAGGRWRRRKLRWRR